MLTTTLDILGFALLVLSVVLAPLFVKLLIISLVILSTSYLMQKKGK